MEKKCWRCGELFNYQLIDTWIDYRGSNYDTRLVKCGHCKEINIIEYIELPKRNNWKIKKGEINGRLYKSGTRAGMD